MSGPTYNTDPIGDTLKPFLALLEASIAKLFLIVATLSAIVFVKAKLFGDTKLLIELICVLTVDMLVFILCRSFCKML